jgi:sugar transferase EpsL
VPSRVGAAVLLVCLTPLLIIIAVVILVATGRPVLFSQPRSGQGGVPFVCLKFRTMRRLGYSLEPDEQRLTRIGRLLRATSLDELPSLWNVVRGEMALVGPRPLLTEYLNAYTPQQRRRLDVKPGLTGWVQVNGRNSLSWKEKFELDIWYVDHRSRLLDAKILVRTLPTVLRSAGISHLGHSTMPNLLSRDDTTEQ